jgi:prevent-host-death family protein
MSFPPAFLSVPNCVQKNVRSDVQIVEAAAETLGRLTPDVCPMTDFRANAARMVARIRATNQPMILTQHGRAAAVVIGIDAYETLIEELTILRDVRDAEDSAAAQTLSAQTSVEARLRAIHGR